MVKSTITNSTYRIVLLAYVVLNVMIELSGLAQGGMPGMLYLFSLAISVLLLALLYLRSQYLRWVVFAFTTLEVIKFMWYISAVNVRYTLYSGNILLVLIIALLAVAIVYLSIGSVKYIRTLPAYEPTEQQPYAANHEPKGFLNKKIINPILIPIALILTLQSTTHYSDGGCDGGLCGLYFIMHGLPLLVAWAFTIMAVNKALGRKDAYFIFLILAFLSNLIIILPDYGYNMGELKYPGYAILVILIASFWLYFYVRNTADTFENDSESKKDF